MAAVAVVVVVLGTGAGAGPSSIRTAGGEGGGGSGLRSGTCGMRMTSCVVNVSASITCIFDAC